MKEMLYAVRCLKSNEDMILAIAGQFKQLSHEPEKYIYCYILSRLFFVTFHEFLAHPTNYFFLQCTDYFWHPFGIIFSFCL